MDKEKYIKLLTQINNSLGEIFTNGENSIILVQCRYQLASIIEELSVEKHEIIFDKINNKDIEDKKE